MVERWGCFEAEFPGPATGNPFTEVTLTAELRHERGFAEVLGFYDGDGVYRFRFLPEREGTWTYRTRSNSPELDGLTGTFECGPPSGGNHGPVRVAHQFHFTYADGTPYLPFGTTCYAWIHQDEALQRQTLETLASAPFNKIRMCVFPKHYDYNHNEPALYAFEGSPADGFDFDRPNPAFFRHLETRVRDLLALGIEADLILFHPYDRWGFSDLGAARDDAYLRYLVARLAGLRNVWWSLANEFDLFFRPDGTLKKTVADWDRIGQLLARWDPAGHLRSIHNCLTFFDHTKPWITHCSVQRVEHAKTAEFTNQWRDLWGKPIVIDECAYEGNINHGWGNIPGTEMTRRFWEGTLRGGYVGHGETYVHPDDVLWWSHGGVLHGTSPQRIAFLRSVVEAAGGPLSPTRKPAGSLFDPHWDVTCGVAEGGYRFYYFSFCQPAFRVFDLPEGPRYHVDVIDTWDMTIMTLPEPQSGRFRVELPGKPFVAVRLRPLPEAGS